MEIGGPYDEMVFDDFDHLEREIASLTQIVEKRQMMTQSQNQKLKAMKRKVHLYADIEHERRDKARDTIDHLLKTYYSYYNG